MSNQILSLPHDVYIILTSNCNLRCVHCYGNYGLNVPDHELTGNEWCKIIEDLAKNDIFYINISGGEPTCHKDFCQIIDCLIKNKMHYILTTNGLFGNDVLKKILESKDYLLGIKISLDGPDFESHCFIRRDINGNVSTKIFDKTIRTIKSFKENNLNFSIGTCLHVKNIDKIIKMQDLIIDLSPNSWTISTISSNGRAQKNNNIFVSESEYSNDFWMNIKKECEKHKITVMFVDMPNLIKSKNHKDVYFQCPAARWFCEINSDGLTTPCPLARTSIPNNILNFDNIKNISIKKIWKGKAFNVFRKWQHSGCDGCLAAGKCDRCVPQSIQWFNDPLMPPPYCIANSKELNIKNQEKLKKVLSKKMKSIKRENYIKDMM